VEIQNLLHQRCMKRFFLLPLSALILISWKHEFYTRNLNQSQGFDHVGTGLLFAYKMEDIPLYISRQSNVPFDTIKISRIIEGKEKGSFRFYTSKSKVLFDPYEHSGGSSDEESKYLINSGLGPNETRLIFRVINHTDNIFEVVISEKEKRTTIIKVPKDQSANILYETWEHYLKRVAAVFRLDRYNNGVVPIFDKPDGKRINVERIYNTHVDSVKGYWARMSGNGKVLGWFQWRDNDKILVGFIEHFIK